MTACITDCLFLWNLILLRPFYFCLVWPWPVWWYIVADLVVHRVRHGRFGLWSKWFMTRIILAINQIVNPCVEPAQHVWQNVQLCVVWCYICCRCWLDLTFCCFSQKISRRESGGGDGNVQEVVRWVEGWRTIQRPSIQSHSKILLQGSHFVLWQRFVAIVFVRVAYYTVMLLHITRRSECVIMKTYIVVWLSLVLSCYMFNRSYS